MWCVATENALYTDQFCGINLKYETHRKFQLKLDSDIFDNKHTDSVLSNHNEMSILYKRLYYNQHGGLTIDAYKFYNFRSGLVLL